jgi:hypothetical protein
VKKYGRSLHLRLFTYAEPSLDSLREVLLMGSAERITDSEEKARDFQERMLARFLKKGFARTFLDRTVFGGGRGSFPRKNVIALAKGDLCAHVYYGLNYRQRWVVRAAVQHPLARRYGDEVASQWPHWWMHDWVEMPDRLIRELEDAGVRGVFPGGTWERIKDIPRTRGNAFHVAELIFLIRRVNPENMPIERRPAFLLLKNYLVRYFFIYGIPEITQKRALEVEQLQGFGIEYSLSKDRRKVNYGESFLFTLAEDCPDTYWGRFAFFETYRMGFGKPTGERPRSWWRDLERKGKEFLEKYPDSEFAPDILFYLGKRMETEYSGYTMRDNRAYHLKNRWRVRPLPTYEESLRRETLHIYERVLSSPKRAEYEEHLRYVLPRLRAGIATGCSYYSPKL